MRRREFSTLLGGAATASTIWPSRLSAQEKVMPLVGVLRVNSRDANEAFEEPFRRYMKELGWDEARSVRFRFVWAGGQNEKVPVLAHELVAQKANLIITFGNLGVKAVQQATTSVPIVGISNDMVSDGLVVSMARPGGNTTGISIFGTELNAKRLELLHEFVPSAHTIAVLADPNQFGNRLQLENAAHALGLELLVFSAQNRDEIGRALDAMEAARVEAVNILTSPFLNAARDVIIERLRRTRLPSIFEWPESAQEGGLLGYGPRALLVYRLVAELADKVLRGAAPGDLPIEQPTRFALAINLKTAKEIGLAIPEALLSRADEVIE
jgi:putative ABC transport system substrate-binding protein